MNGAILATMLLAASPNTIVAEDVPAPIGGVVAPDFPPITRSYAPSMLLYYPAPYYDCYSRNRGWLDCYPGFHERHYRRPYNYRVLFDYPWHEDVYRTFPDAVVLDDCNPAEWRGDPLASTSNYGQRVVSARTRTPRRTLDAPRAHSARTALRDPH